MSGSGAPVIQVSGQGKKVVVISTSWHTQIMDGLVAGAKAELEKSGCEDITYWQIPGAFELPLAAQAAAKFNPDAIIALGVGSSSRARRLTLITSVLRRPTA